MHDDKTDGSGNTADPHSETELKQLEDTYEKGLRLQEKTLDTNSLARARWSEYSFGKTIVSKYVWVKKGAGFLNPDHIDAELMNRPPVFEIHAHGASSGNFFGKVVFEKKSYWVVAPWEHLPRSRSYKFKLVNGGSKGTVDIKHGNVRYN
nr:hypothetical protein [Campylobacter jejuni]